MPLALPSAYVVHPCPLESSQAVEVLVRWQCDAVRGAPAGTYVPSRSTAGYVVQVRTCTAYPQRALLYGRSRALQYSPTAPPAAAWQTISAATGTQDVACMLYHAAPPPPPAAVRAAAAPHLFAAWYRVAGVDYWGRTGNWSDAGAAVVSRISAQAGLIFVMPRPWPPRSPCPDQRPPQTRLRAVASQSVHAIELSIKEPGKEQLKRCNLTCPSQTTTSRLSHAPCALSTHA